LTCRQTKVHKFNMIVKLITLKIFLILSFQKKIFFKKLLLILSVGKYIYIFLFICKWQWRARKYVLFLFLLFFFPIWISQTNDPDQSLLLVFLCEKYLQSFIFLSFLYLVLFLTPSVPHADVSNPIHLLIGKR